MDEPVDFVIMKTGVAAAIAKTIITLVIKNLKKELRSPDGAQIDGLLGIAGTVKMA